MASEKYYLETDSTGAFTGGGYSPDGTLPSGAVECTQAQANDPASFKMSNGSIVAKPPTLAEARQAQIAQINDDAQSAINTPITFTNAAGTQATFPMTAQVKYLAAYTRYVVHGKSLPSGFAFLDVNGKSVPMTVADIDNMAALVFDQVEAAETKLGTLITQIESAATVSAVQAIAW